MDNESFFNFIKENDIEFIDFRFSDILGRCYHISYIAKSITEAMLIEGVDVDICKIPSFAHLKHSLKLKPDLTSGFMDPFSAQNTYIIFTDLINADINELSFYDNREIVKRTHDYLKSTNIVDKIKFDINIGFFIFDNIEVNVERNSSYYKINSSENLNHFKAKSINRLVDENIYMALQPTDDLNDIRSEIMIMMRNIGIESIMHYQGCSAAKANISFRSDNLIQAADDIQKSKYIIKNIANSYGKSVTFMPKPINSPDYSHIYLKQILYNNDKIIHDKQIQYYINGIKKYENIIAAFTNSTLNSYKNGKVGINISRNEHIKIDQIDSCSNPYLFLCIITLAGINGILNKIDINEKNFNSFSLKESIDYLLENINILTNNNIFTKEFIMHYIEIKKLEILKQNSVPHPTEFSYYYNL